MDLGDTLIEAGTIRPGAVVALVGAGGKTTLMWALCAAGARRGWRTLAGTTTRVGVDQVARLDEFLFSRRDHDKLVGVEPEVVDATVRSGRFDLVVIEADGARGKVVKAPGAHEPVIPRSVTLAVTVIGAGALDRVIEDVAHRPMRVAALSGCSPYERLTVSRACVVLRSSSGGAKSLPPGARQLVAVTRVGPRQEALAHALVAAIQADGGLAVALPEIAAEYSRRP